MSSTRTLPTTYPAPYEGTWDEDSQKYLLPNLVGLPYEQMIRNGEGARHGGDAQYYRLILIHGLFAAFAFLILTPAALICARFLTKGPRPRLAMWGHIGFQIGSIICITITFITGYYAIGGKENWGKNPHHMIGAAIYAGMLFQAFTGVLVRWRIHKKIRKYVPLHQMLHQWLGRGVFLLGLAQIPLGLFVYGSPLTLFVLYAVLVFIFLCVWFLCEYLQDRGWFHRGFRGAEGPSMTEHTHQALPQGPLDDSEHRAGADVALQQPLQTPRKSRFSKLSWLVNRRQTNSGVATEGFRYNGIGHDGATSVDTSRAPSAAHTPALGGLAPGPGRKQGYDMPPVPPMPAGMMERYNSPGSQASPGDREHQSVKNTVLRGSTTLPGVGGRAQGEGEVSMPNPHIPNSPNQPSQAYDPMLPPMPSYGASPQSSVSGPSYRGHAQYDMPPSPLIGGGYVEANDGFVPSPVSEPPAAPLPMRPHRRDRSVDTVPRLPTSHAIEPEPLNIAPRQPNIAVQVKLNPDKSVSVRRLPPDEAERERRERDRQRAQRAPPPSSTELEEAERRERARQRSERAMQAEMELERERQLEVERRQRRAAHQRGDSRDRRPTTSGTGAERSDRRPTTSGTGAEWSDRRPTTSGAAAEPRGSREHSRLRQDSFASEASDLRPPYTPSIGGQSSTIAHASGGLLGNTQSPPIPSPGPPAGVHMSPLIGLTPVRASVVSNSGTVTAENSEMEQEIVKEQRRRKRREERDRAGGSRSDRWDDTVWT